MNAATIPSPDADTPAQPEKRGLTALIVKATGVLLAGSTSAPAPPSA